MSLDLKLWSSKDISREKLEFFIKNNILSYLKKSIDIPVLDFNSKGSHYAFKQILKIDNNELFPDNWIEIIDNHIEDFAKNEALYYEEEITQKDIDICRKTWNTWKESVKSIVDRNEQILAVMI